MKMIEVDPRVEWNDLSVDERALLRGHYLRGEIPGPTRMRDLLYALAGKGLALETLDGNFVRSNRAIELLSTILGEENLVEPVKGGDDGTA
jgi:hypothetical protein